jgi:16S rRNA (guanine527-N7)-methyltransferase
LAEARQRAGALRRAGRRLVGQQEAELAQDRQRALALTPVPAETAARLDSFVAVLLDWQQRMNLVAASTVPQLWTRHVADSLQLVRLAPEARTWVDLGSGAGFPGLVLACALAERGTVHLVESSGKKCAFLRAAARAAGVAAEVHCERIERFTDRFREPVDVVTARALAPLFHLFALAAPLLKTGAVGLFPKGQDVDAELTEASKSWNMVVEIEPSVTAAEGRIVVVRRLAPRTAAPAAH